MATNNEQDTARLEELAQTPERERSDLHTLEMLACSIRIESRKDDCRPSRIRFLTLLIDNCIENLRGDESD